MGLSVLKAIYMFRRKKNFNIFFIQVSEFLYSYIPSLPVDSTIYLLIFPHFLVLKGP